MRRRPLRSPAAWPCRAASEGADYAQVDIIQIAGRRGYVVKILNAAGKIRQRDVLQQPERHGTDGANLIAAAGSGTKNLDRLALRNPRTVNRLREISLTLGNCGNGRERVIGIAGARPVVIHKEESLRAAVVDPGNDQRTAERGAKALLQVSRLADGLSGQ